MTEAKIQRKKEKANTLEPLERRVSKAEYFVQDGGRFNTNLHHHPSRWAVP
jgi:hypothetical protein